MRPEMKRKIAWMAPLALVGGALFIALGGEIVHLLWNWLLPELFGLPRVTFWQALGLLALARILFGGVGMRGSGRSGRHRMTPEERQRFGYGFGCGAKPEPAGGEIAQP